MSIASSGGPHTVQKFRKVTTLAANNSPIDAFLFVDELRCFVLPASTEDVVDFARKDITVNSMIAFFSDPGVVDEKTVFAFRHRNKCEIHEVKGFTDQCNLEFLFTAYTMKRNGQIDNQIYPANVSSPFSIRGSSSVGFASA